MIRILTLALLCLTGCGPVPMCGELPCTGDPCGPFGPAGLGGDPALCRAWERAQTADAGTVWPS